MVVAMAKERKKDHAKDIGSLLKDKLTNKITRRAFFAEENPDIREKIERFWPNISLEYLDSVIRKKISAVGPMARSDLSVLELQGNNSLSLGKLFLQIYNSRKRRPVGESPAMSAQQLEMGGLEEVAYRQKHMDFWNEVALPAPYLIGVARELDTNGDYAVGLITEFWPGVTHDLDVLAIHKRMEQVEVLIRSEFTPESRREKLLEEFGKLEEMRTNIVRSVLSTIDEFAVIGTEALEMHRGLWKDTRHTDFEFYKKKVLDYFSVAHDWHCVVDKKLDLKGQKRRLRREFAKYMDPIVQAVADQTKFVYAQGDEFLHHFQYRKFTNGSSTKLRSGVFDADHACFNRLERSRSKILLSPLLNFNYESVHDLLKEADDELHVRLNALPSWSSLRDRLGHLVLPANTQSRLEFDLVAIYESICMIGRAAKDDMTNWEHSIKRRQKTPQYSNPFLNFPADTPDSVELAAYDSKPSIAKLVYRLNERIDIMLEGPTRYSKVEDPGLTSSLTGLKTLLKDFTIPETLEYGFKQGKLRF